MEKRQALERGIALLLGKILKKADDLSYYSYSTSISSRNIEEAAKQLAIPHWCGIITPKGVNSQVINIKDEVRTKMDIPPPGAPEISLSWLAFEGEQPDTPYNPSPAVLDAFSKADALEKESICKDKSDAKQEKDQTKSSFTSIPLYSPFSIHGRWRSILSPAPTMIPSTSSRLMLSDELLSLSSEITSCIISSQKTTRERTLTALEEESGISSLIPDVVKFVNNELQSEVEKEAKRLYDPLSHSISSHVDSQGNLVNSEKYLAIVQCLEALTRNSSLHITHTASLTHTLLSALLFPFPLSIENGVCWWLVKEQAAQVLIEFICRKCVELDATVGMRCADLLLRVLLDHEASLATRIGAAMYFISCQFDNLRHALEAMLAKWQHGMGKSLSVEAKEEEEIKEEEEFDQHMGKDESLVEQPSIVRVYSGYQSDMKKLFVSGVVPSLDISECDEKKPKFIFIFMNRDSLKKYAVYIGCEDVISKPFLKNLLYTAATAPIPCGWATAVADGKRYYYDRKSREPSWNLPCDLYFRSVISNRLVYSQEEVDRIRLPSTTPPQIHHSRVYTSSFPSCVCSVMSMCTYLNIDPYSEADLIWIAVLALIKPMDDVWRKKKGVRRVYDDGTVEEQRDGIIWEPEHARDVGGRLVEMEWFEHKLTKEEVYEHPGDMFYLSLLEEERSRKKKMEAKVKEKAERRKRDEEELKKIIEEKHKRAREEEEEEEAEVVGEHDSPCWIGFLLAKNVQHTPSSLCVYYNFHTDEQVNTMICDKQHSPPHSLLIAPPEHFSSPSWLSPYVLYLRHTTVIDLSIVLKIDGRLRMSKSARQRQDARADILKAKAHAYGNQLKSWLLEERKQAFHGESLTIHQASPGKQYNPSGYGRMSQKQTRSPTIRTSKGDSHRLRHLPSPSIHARSSSGSSSRPNSSSGRTHSARMFLLPPVETEQDRRRVQTAHGSIRSHQKTGKRGIIRGGRTYHTITSDNPHESIMQRSGQFVPHPPSVHRSSNSSSQTSSTDTDHEPRESYGQASSRSIVSESVRELQQTGTSDVYGASNTLTPTLSSSEKRLIRHNQLRAKTLLHERQRMVSNALSRPPYSSVLLWALLPAPPRTCSFSAHWVEYSPKKRYCTATLYVVTRDVETLSHKGGNQQAFMTEDRDTLSYGRIGRMVDLDGARGYAKESNDLIHSLPTDSKDIQSGLSPSKHGSKCAIPRSPRGIEKFGNEDGIQPQFHRHSLTAAQCWEDYTPLHARKAPVIKMKYNGTYVDDFSLSSFASLGFVEAYDCHLAIEVFNAIEDILSGLFIVLHRNSCTSAMKQWCSLLVLFSTIPSLVPRLAHRKYVEKFELCRNCIKCETFFSRFLGNVYPELKKWDEIISTISGFCDDPSSKVWIPTVFGKFVKKKLRESGRILYYEVKESILSVLKSSVTQESIHQNRKEIILYIASIFLAHLSRINQHLDGAIDNEYCKICVNFSYVVKSKIEPFISNIFPCLDSILKRGPLRLRPRNLLLTIRNISNTSSLSIKHSIADIIVPHFESWMRNYPDDSSMRIWTNILGNITYSEKSKTSIQDICSKVWPHFSSIFSFLNDSMRSSEHREQWSKDLHHYLFFFSNLSSNPLYASKIYECVENVLYEWYCAIKQEKKVKLGLDYWCKLVSIFSSISGDPKFASNIPQTPSVPSHLSKEWLIL
ncbi:Transcription initiation factor TFIID subunit 6 like protein [Aduncisulcus paluster]|uniref:Transcription initiation factor TFIID subunit 6 like protein n=1 Tax=Aduncisulcus paluster TaxID=2918883 RepID=A0ABQ5K2C9_9EUKA|nr:Transcription initiation factor TFIID subunit 6 like protein [Aduncisulcus paluster]